MPINAERKKIRESFIKQFKSYLAGDGNLWGRMASSSSGATGVNSSFVAMAEELRSKGITADTVEEYINSLPYDLADDDA